MSEPKISVLVVDDDKALLDILTSLLRQEGHEVESVPSAFDALERLRDQSFDLILADLKMRRMNGIELLEAARLKNPRARVVIMTAFSTVATAVEAMRKGAFDYLSKPFRLAELRDLLQRVAQAKAQTEQESAA